MPARPWAAGRSAEAARDAIEAFLQSARQPALLEPGEELLALTSENYELSLRADRLTLQAWDRTRNLTRRVMDVRQDSAARLELAIQRFGGREGQVFLLDLSRRAGAEMGRRSGRLVFRERFRIFLRRQFPEWTLAELSAEPDLEHSLSPSFPRAFLKHGQHAWAAIACPVEGDAAAVVTFALIWLSYLRARERRVTVEGLAIYVPQRSESAPSLRLLCLNPSAARFELFTYDEHDEIVRIDAHDHGNLDTRLEPCRRSAADDAGRWRDILELPGVERVCRHDGSTSLRVRGIEFGELRDGVFYFGMGQKEIARDYRLSEIQRFVEELDRARNPLSDSANALYRQYPEAWLESQARAHIVTIDASLQETPIYGQVPAFAGGDRGIMDLLAVDRTGRLAVIELKASQDVHLPLQALDYWIRVKWHLDRGEFTSAGYFPGVQLRTEAPKLLLVGPALEFHPATETLLDYFSPEIEVERVGVAADWRTQLRTMFRLRAAERPAFVSAGTSRVNAPFTPELK